MNSKTKKISRGDAFYADLSPVVGCEQGGVRPVLILQNDVGNRHSPTTIVCAITGNIEKTPLPTHVLLDGIGRHSKTSVALLEQLRTIDRSRLLDRIGSLEPEEFNRVNQALAISIGLDPELTLRR